MGTGYFDLLLPGYAHKASLFHSIDSLLALAVSAEKKYSLLHDGMLNSVSFVPVGVADLILLALD